MYRLELIIYTISYRLQRAYSRWSTLHVLKSTEPVDKGCYVKVRYRFG